MEKFNYANKNNFLQWFLLIFTGIVTVFLIFLFLKVGNNGKFTYELLIPIIGFSIIFFITINKMFLSNIYITTDYIEYKSPFTNVKIQKKEIKGIDLIKKPRKRAPKYLSLNERPTLNIGNYFLIIRKNYIKPDSAYFLTFMPIEENYITVEYRDAFFEKLLEYGYIKKTTANNQ